MADDERVGAVDVPGRPGVNMPELFEADTRPVPDFLKEDQSDFARLPDGDIGAHRYISKDFHDLEMTRMWGRVWQIACHEDQIQNVGDYVVYEIGRTSLIVARTAPDTIKAFYNACLHRGRMLCEKGGHAQNFRCKFHGFMWRLDGRLGFVPSRWDFPELRDEDYALPEAKVARWLGFVFINLDHDARPLEDYLGGLPAHFKSWKFENRRLVGHVGQVIRANWKVCVEAFLEFYHGMATHPQILPGTSDVNTRYVTRRDEPHYSYMVMPMGVPSPFVADNVNDQQVLDNVLQAVDHTIAPGTHQLPPGKGVRAHYADIKRSQLAKSAGRDFAGVSDTEMIDGWVYSVFPNITLWGAYGMPLWYRFRPWRDDPEMALMEVFIMPEFPEGAARPPAPKMTLLGPDQRFNEAPEFGVAGEFFNQDLDNLEWVQKGLHTTRRAKMTFARYQESENRQFHHVLDSYINGDGPKPRES